MNIPVEVEFIRLSSYGAGKETSGKIKLVQGLKSSIEDRHVLVVEDIIDRGLTVHYLLDYLSRRKPYSLKLCALFDKSSRRRVEVPINYIGFTIPDAFVVGYGLDFNEKFRYLPDLCVLEE
jgi:hypoxanthine phosphoribosyltransferase